MQVEVNVCDPFPQYAEQGVISLHDDQDGQGCIMHCLCLNLFCMLLPKNKIFRVYCQLNVFVLINL